MREIKFRAWHKSFSPELEEDGMGRINGMYQVKGIWISNSFQKYVDLNNFTMGSVDLWGWKSSCKINEVYLMQYTGLKDKNGKEIYEGDCPGGIFEGSHIGWCKHCKSFQLFITSIKEYGPCKQCEGDVSWLDFIEDPIEIIGNIYENPKLLNNNP